MRTEAVDCDADLREAIDRYNEAWNAHDLDAIMAMHAPDMVFDNHTAGESASSEEARAHIGSIFETWPDIEFSTRRLYVREDLVVQEWTATATHAKRMTRGDLVAEPTGNRVDLGRPRRDPLRGRPGQAQGRLLRQRLDPAPGRPARLTELPAQRLQSGSKAFLASTFALPPP